MKQLLLGVGKKATYECNPWEKGNKLGKSHNLLKKEMWREPDYPAWLKEWISVWEDQMANVCGAEDLKRGRYKEKEL